MENPWTTHRGTERCMQMHWKRARVAVDIFGRHIQVHDLRLGTITMVYCDTLAPWQRLCLSRLVEVRDTRQWRAEKKQHDASV